MAPTPTCDHVHGANRCTNKRHKTSSKKIVKLCTYHYKKSRSKRAKTTKTTKKELSEEKRAKDVTKKRNSRQRIKDMLTGINNKQIREFTEKLTLLKTTSLKYIIVKDVIEDIAPREIKRKGDKDAITFTDPKAPKTRSMQFVNVIASLSPLRFNIS